MGMLFGQTSSSCFLPMNGPEVLQLPVSPPLFPYSTYGEEQMTCHKVKSGKSNWAHFLQLHSLLPLEGTLATESTDPPSGPKCVLGPPHLEAAVGWGQGECKAAEFYSSSQKPVRKVVFCPVYLLFVSFRILLINYG